MKKTILLFVIFTTFGYQAQNLVSFGPTIGFNAYDIEIEGPLIAGGAVSGLNIGGFVDYQLSRGFGARALLTYNTIKENEYALTSNGTYNVLSSDSELKTLQLQGLMRYDTAGDYNKGFYLTGGFRMVNVLSAKIDGNDGEDFYKKTSFAALLGFGVTISRTVGLELMGDASITSTLENAKTKNYGICANLTVDLSSVFTK